jgi:hypothetical protein
MLGSIEHEGRYQDIMNTRVFMAVAATASIRTAVGDAVLVGLCERGHAR